jgi:tungstate transport system substrate-binding protein
MAMVMAVSVACGDDDGDSGGQIGGTLILATTTSTLDSGLLDVLGPMFTEETGIEFKPIAVGTGAALEMARTGDADAVLVHAPASEKEYVDSGDLVEGALVMHNDFVIVGPADDPAGVKDAAGLDAAMAAMGAGTVVSRGDDSGTHKKELALWKAAGIETAAVANYVESGQGMGATLNIANERRAYTLADRATFLALSKDLDLEIVFEGAAPLLNIYHVYAVNPEKHSGVHTEQARAWVAFMVSESTQEVIG